MSENTVIDVIDLRKDYRLQHQSVTVLRGISMKVGGGEILAILGHSGVGKSTLLNLLGLLDTPTSGQIFYRGRDPEFRDRDLASLSSPEKARTRNRNFGFVFQFYHLLPDLTVRENVLLPAMIHYRTREFRRRRAELTRRADDLLERVGISHRSSFPPTRLSGGERQRAAIARSLFNDPEVVYCDEPTGNLDTRTGEKIHRLILDLNRELRTTFILVTHDEDLASLAHRKLRMVDGLFEDGASALRLGVGNQSRS